MNAKTKLVCYLVAAVFGMVAFASAGTVNIQFTSTSSGLGGPASNGVYYYPYQLSINGAGDINVACDDYSNEVYLNETWKAYENTFTYSGDTVTGMTNSPSGTGPMFYDTTTGNSDASYWNSHGMSGVTDLTLYEDAAWLYQELVSVPTNTDESEAINWAIWELFDPSAGSNPDHTSNQDTTSAYWISQAYLASESNWGDMNFSYFVFLTPESGTAMLDGNPEGMPQEYITEITPEPASLALFMGGLGLLAFFEMKRRRAGVSL